MRFYVDECLSRLTVEFLRHRRHNTVYATELGFIGKGDAFHYARAREMNRILVIRDGDFSNPRRINDVELRKPASVEIIPYGK